MCKFILVVCTYICESTSVHVCLHVLYYILLIIFSIPIKHSKWRKTADQKIKQKQYDYLHLCRKISKKPKRTIQRKNNRIATNKYFWTKAMNILEKNKTFLVFENYLKI